MYEDRKTQEILQNMRLQADTEQTRFLQYQKKPQQDETENTGNSHTGTFRIRLALAGVLFLTVLLLDQKGKNVAGISMDQVFRYLTAVDYGTYLETLVDTAINDWQAL